VKLGLKKLFFNLIFLNSIFLTHSDIIIVIFFFYTYFSKWVSYSYYSKLYEKKFV